MKSTNSKNEATGYPEFGVCADVIRSFFSPTLPKSTFFDFVKKGKIVPMKGIRGLYLLNDSLRRLGLREVRELPKPPFAPSLEDIVRLAFTLIDPDLFPAPSWLLDLEAIDAKDVDHATRLAEQNRDEVDAFEHVALKQHYFQGVLDWAHMEASSAEA